MIYLLKYASIVQFVCGVWNAKKIIIITIFFIGKTRIARYLLGQCPEYLIGPLFNKLRLFWKKISRPTKRKGLGEYKVKIDNYK